MGDQELLGQRIGHIRIVDFLARGGMGAVYIGFDEKLERRVALKAVHEGRLDENARARFLREARVLSQLNHPHICQIYGYLDGQERDFLVLELIEGKSLKDVIAERPDQATQMRIALEVVEVLAATHAQGIIHRDLKPSNVMVTPKGATKVLDFGLARVTNEDAGTWSIDLSHGVAGPATSSDYAVTRLGVLVGTLAYMSPEQARGETLTSATDMYSYGLLLQELLTGERAYPRGLSAEQQLAKAQAGETLPVHGLGPELTALIERLKSPAPAVRPSALDTSERLRFILDEPRRRLRRYLMAAGLVVATTVAVGMTYLAYRIRQEAAEARRQTAIAKAVNAFLNDDLLAAVAPSAQRGKGKDVTMREALDAAAARIDQASKDGGRFAAEPLVEASIRATLGATYRELGELSAAEPHLRRALELRRRTLGEEHLETARAMNQLGLLEWRHGRPDQAEPLFRRSLELCRRLLGPDDTETLAYEMNVANVYRSQGRYQEAEPLYERNLAAKRRVLGAEHSSTLDTMSNLANHYQETGRYDKAEVLHRQALDVWRRNQGEKSPSAVSAMNNLANDLALLGRSEEAAPLMERTLALKIELYGADHPSTLNSVNNLAELDDQLGRDAQAEPLHRRAFEGRLRVLGPDHARTLESMGLLAGSLSNLGRFAEAEGLAGRAAAGAAKSLGERHLVTLAAEDARACALLGLGRAADAEAILRRQLAILEVKKQKGEDAGEGEARAQAMRVHLGMALAEQGRRAEAEALLIEAIPRLPPRDARTARALRFIVQFYEKWNRAQPDADRVARAAEWRRRLEATPAAGVAR
jgi:tRNA A-37 threonylcarbamoyl transferase component Bud32/tetratricopeptide (TPR) repeat protein